MSKLRKIILASTSPSRSVLLARTNLKFSVEASDYEEKIDQTILPHILVKRLSQGKARGVASRYANAIIIGADTVAVLNNRVIGKPKNNADARRMLQALSGRSHWSLTGLTVIDTAHRREITRVVKTKVIFRKLTRLEIRAYVDSGEPLGKAAAYALQGLGSVLVKSVEGDPHNVMGLPMATLTEVLSTMGVKVL